MRMLMVNGIYGLKLIFFILLGYLSDSFAKRKEEEEKKANMFCRGFFFHTINVISCKNKRRQKQKTHTQNEICE